MTTVIDQPARSRALRADQSFIVRAPAGSGKTGLLVQRFLVLLATVTQPEQVLAITFTRKAAAEMRDRVMAALASVADQEPSEGYDRDNWRLAREVIRRDELLGWHLTSQPARLRIHTIDALATSLTRQLPWQASLSAGYTLVDDCTPLYLEAASNTLLTLGSTETWSSAVATVIRFCQNDIARTSELLADMLSRRDQWLRQVHRSIDREQVEKTWSQLVQRQLEIARTAVPDALIPDLIACATHAATELKVQGKDSAIQQLAGITALPGTDPSHLNQWRAMTELLTVVRENGKWRSPGGVNKNLGFPNQSLEQKESKQRMQTLLERLSDEAALRSALAGTWQLPPADYHDDQWQLILALYEVLKVATGQLMLVFKQSGRLDFTELNLRAIRALGEPGRPSELALRWDSHLQHLLIDEFQDTSRTQVELFALLTAGWQGGEGRSLFLVGDPMQSIYRFREAEVGLFLDVWQQQRFGQLPIEPIQLTANFRSSQVLVEWVNQSFPRLDLERADRLLNRVEFASAVAANKGAKSSEVKFYFDRNDESQQQAVAIANLVNQQRQRYPEDSIAILVRSRSHLAEITPALEALGVDYQGLETQPLLTAAAVRDCLSLLRALLHPADRVAWLAIFRAPWIGLTLEDLFLLAQDAADLTLWQCMSDPQRVRSLSEDGQQRLDRIRPVLDTALATVNQQPPAIWLETVWRALNTVACYPASELLLVEQLLLETESCSSSELAARISEFESELQRSWVSNGLKQSNVVQVMTMHKAKGLEFDCVILPSLERRTGRDNPPLLRWEEVVTDGAVSLLVASRSRSAGDRDPHHHYLSLLTQKREQAEVERLFYVACTRAKKRLYGFACLKLDQDGQIRRPDSRSLLGHCWSMFEDSTGQYTASKDRVDQPAVHTERARKLVRIALSAKPIVAEQTRLTLPPAIAVPDTVDFQWAGESARQVGNLVHHCLQQIANQGWQRWWQTELKQRHGGWLQYLRLRGLLPPQIEDALMSTHHALQSVSEDPRARWILQAHVEESNEWVLIDASQVPSRRLVLDRSFIDEDGVRWIIDYKTSSHQGAGLDVFLNEEQKRYHEQLQTYARALAAYQQHPVRLGLYFPLLKAWREWDYDPQRTL